MLKEENQSGHNIYTIYFKRGVWAFTFSSFFYTERINTMQIDITKETFHSPTLGRMTFDEVTARIDDYVDFKYGDFEIIVGADSQRHKHVVFITAVAVRRLGRGSIYFYIKETNKQKFTMETRLLTEVYYATMLASALQKGLEKYDLDVLIDEVHADINIHNKSGKVAKQATGMIRGLGFTPVIKPDGYVASYIADRHSKK